MPTVWDLLRLATVAARARSTREFYDRISSSYDSLFTEHLPHMRTMVVTLAERFTQVPDTKVLDVAWGTGALSRRLEEQGFCVSALDFSFQSLLVMKKMAPTIRSVQGDAVALPFPSASFDAVTCMGAWRHFQEPERVLAEICRVLRPHGVFIVGYFPPKLGGLFHIPAGQFGEMAMSLYRQVVKVLNYTDKVGEGVELEAFTMINAAFRNCRRIPSSGDEYLLLAESPGVGKLSLSSSP